MLVLVLFGCCGLILGVRRHRRLAVVRRVASIDRCLAPTIDLVVVVVGSGGTIHEALTTVASVGPAPVRPAVRQVLAESDGGGLLPDALGRAYEGLTPAFHPLIGLLINAERDGGPLSVLLQHLADDAEQARKWASEAAAKRLPVLLLVPLVVCLLPALIIGALVPLVVLAVRQLGA